METLNSKKFAVLLLSIILICLSLVSYPETQNDATATDNTGIVSSDPVSSEKVDTTADTSTDASAVLKDSTTPDPATPASSDGSVKPVDPVSSDSSTAPPVDAAAGGGDESYPYLFGTVPAPKSPIGSRGSFQTDLYTGSASYNYDFELPKGTNGLTPQIGLNYNSQSVSGRAALAGAGWDLRLSYIERDVNYTPDNLMTIVLT